MNSHEKYYEINLMDVLKILIKHKKLIIFTTFFGIIISLISALNVTKLYVSEAKLMPATSEYSNSSNMASELGGALSLFGGGYSNVSQDKTKEAVAFINSRTFFRILYENENFVKDLFTSKQFNKQTNELIYDNEKYDVSESQFIDKISFEQAFYDFHNGIFLISENLETGIYTLKIKHISPYAAAYWLERIIIGINDFIKIRSVDETEKKIKFYESKIIDTNIASLRALFSNNLARELQTIAYSEATDEFAFNVIDFPYVPERPSEPSRTIIVILGTILSFLMSCMISIIYHFIFGKQS